MTNRVHPLFRQVILNATHPPSVEMRSEAWWKWSNAGEPVLAEEETKFVLQPPASEVLRVGPDGGWTVFIPHACDKDARIKELEAKLEQALRDGKDWVHFGKQTCDSSWNAAIEAVADIAIDLVDTTSLKDIESRIRSLRK